MYSLAFHLSYISFLRAADNPGGLRLATPIPPIRITPKTLPHCSERLNPPRKIAVVISMHVSTVRVYEWKGRIAVRSLVL